MAKVLVSHLLLRNNLKIIILTPFYTITSSFHNSSSNTDNQSYLKDQKPYTVTVKEREAKDPLLKRILIVDDEPDVALTFKVGLEGYYYQDNEKSRFETYTYNDPLQALSEFKPHFYDLMLVDVYMPDMSGFQFCEKLLKVDPNIRVCFISAAELNMQALREVYPKLGFGCFIKKPVEMEYLVERLCAELD